LRELLERHRLRRISALLYGLALASFALGIVVFAFVLPALRLEGLF